MYLSINNFLLMRLTWLLYSHFECWTVILSAGQSFREMFFFTLELAGEWFSMGLATASKLGQFCSRYITCVFWKGH